MQTSQLRIDLEYTELNNLIKHLKIYSSTYVIGHEISKLSKKSHFHVHFEHKKHIDTVRRHFRKHYPQIKQMGFYLKKIKTTNQKSIAYCIKDGKYVHEMIIPTDLEEAKNIVLTFKEEENLKTLRDKIIYRLNETEHSNKWMVNTEIMVNILLIFKSKNLTYPSQSWMKQCIITYWMQEPSRLLAMDNIEKIYNIQDPFVTGNTTGCLK